MIGAGEGIVDIAVGPGHGAGEAESQHIGNNRGFDGAGHINRRIVTGSRVEKTRNVTPEARFYRIHIDRAAGGVAAVQSPLGAAEDFQALQVIQLLAMGGAKALVNLVDIYTDRRRRRGGEFVGHGNPANGEVRLSAAVGTGHLDVRHRAHKVAGFDDALLP